MAFSLCFCSLYARAEIRLLQVRVWPYRSITQPEGYAPPFSISTHALNVLPFLQHVRRVFPCLCCCLLLLLRSACAACLPLRCHPYAVVCSV